MEPGKDDLSLQHALQRDLSPAGAASLLVFFAFAMQCMSTLAVVRRETGGWKLAGHPVRLHERPGLRQFLRGLPGAVAIARRAAGARQWTRDE
jgi:hypothetical protein